MYNRYYTSARAVAPAGHTHGATAWPGFKGFRGFCLPLAGGFKGCGGGSRRKYKKGAASRQHCRRQHSKLPLNQPALWAEPIGQCVST